MYFGIYDNKTIQNLDIKGKKAILIRILEPSYLKGGIPYKIQNINEYVNVLELYFDDIINPRLQNSEDYIYFSEDMAAKLNNFILDNDFDEVAIHCSAGISRSPAIGICVAKILGNKSLENQLKHYKHFIPNRQVLSTFNSYKYVEKTSSSDIEFRNLKIYNFEKNFDDSMIDIILSDSDEER